MNPVMEGILGGWRIVGINTADERRADQPVVFADRELQRQRQSDVSPEPDRRSAHAERRRRRNYLNPATVVVPTDQTQPFGNAPRNAARGTPFNQLDLGLHKSFGLQGDSKRIEARIEAFNLFNHTNFQTANGNRSSAAFGTITSGVPGAPAAARREVLLLSVRPQVTTEPAGEAARESVSGSPRGEAPRLRLVRMASRREILKASVLLPMIATAAGVEGVEQTGEGRRIVVVGAGAFGGWTALELRRRGARVTLIDAWGPGNARASSGGETRVIRATYGARTIYTKMAVRAMALWRAHDAKWERGFFRKTGALWMFGERRRVRARVGDRAARREAAD